MDLIHLKELVFKDSDGYKDDFLSILSQFLTQLELALSGVPFDESGFIEQLRFLAGTSRCFKEEGRALGTKIFQLLRDKGSSLSPNLRLEVVKSVVQLRAKELVDDKQSFLELSEMLRLSDKKVRETVMGHLISSGRKIRDQKRVLDRQLLAFKGMKDESSATLSSLSAQLSGILYKNGAWKDARTLHAMSEGCFSPHEKTVLCCLHFFLRLHAFDDSVEEDAKMGQVSEKKKELAEGVRYGGSKKDRTLKKLRSKLKTVSSLEKRMENEEGIVTNPIQDIRNPFEFSEKLFADVRKSSWRFEIRLLQIDLVSRLLGYHELFIPNFFPFMQKYATPNQENVTKVLGCCCQAVHALVPPDVLFPLVKTIANQLVSDRSSAMSISVGLNSIREICVRQPLAMEEDLLSDLLEFRKYSDKSVVIAARSLLQVFRDLNPSLLHRRDLGRDAAVIKSSKRARKFGEIRLEAGEDYLNVEDGEEDDGEDEGEMENDDEDSDYDVRPGDFVDPEELDTYVDRERRTKEERLVSVHAGRGENLFGIPGRKLRKKSTGTNKDKLKGKATMMIVKSGRVRSKQSLSLQAKQRRITRIRRKEKMRKR
jgi:protein SDA1